MEDAEAFPDRKGLSMGMRTVTALVSFRIAYRKGDEGIMAEGMTRRELTVSEAENVLGDYLDGTELDWRVEDLAPVGGDEDGALVAAQLTAEAEGYDEADVLAAQAHEDLDELGEVERVKVL